MMMNIYQTYTVESKALDSDLGIYEAMVSMESVDRDEDIILADGAIIDNYLRNPVVLWGHNYSDPEAIVARALEVVKIPGVGVKLVFQFIERGINKTADLVRDLWDGGYLRAMSVGFFPQVSEPRVDENGERRRGYIYRAWELLEGSIVTIPANQDALRLAISDMTTKGYQPELIESVLSKRGRVLSASNEKRIREAITSLQAVIDSLGETQDDDDEKGISGGEITPDAIQKSEEPAEHTEPITDETPINASEDLTPVYKALETYVFTLKQNLTQSNEVKP
jgi:hypothetical protein